MLVCPRCGNQNPLGRVFCLVCGSKLDLSRLSSQTVAETLKPNWFAIHWPKFAYGFLAFLGILVVTALWPVVQPLGETGADLKGQQLERQLDRIRTTLRPGQRLMLAATEKEINAFLGIKARKIGAASISAEIGSDYVRLHLVRPFFSLPLLVTNKVWEPRYSWTLAWVVSGNALYLSRAKIGHLKAVGPLRYFVYRRALRLAAQEKEWDLASMVQGIKAEKGKLTVTFAR